MGKNMKKIIIINLFIHYFVGWYLSLIGLNADVANLFLLFFIRLERKISKEHEPFIVTAFATWISHPPHI